MSALFPLLRRRNRLQSVTYNACRHCAAAGCVQESSGPLQLNVEARRDFLERFQSKKWKRRRAEEIRGGWLPRDTSYQFHSSSANLGRASTPDLRQGHGCNLKLHSITHIVGRRPFTHAPKLIRFLHISHYQSRDVYVSFLLFFCARVSLRLSAL